MALLAWVICSTMWSFPSCFTYFNELSGGYKSGHRHLLHSSLDWGQSLLMLDGVIDSHDWGPVGVIHTGLVSPHSIGSRARMISRNEPAVLNHYSHVAISAEVMLKAQQLSNDGVDWGFDLPKFCSDIEPVHYVDGSFFVYDTNDLRSIYSDERDEVLDSFASSESVMDGLPPFADRVSGVSGLLHALILHEFGDLGLTGMGQPATGLDALRILTDERRAIVFFGETQFVRTRNGLRFRLQGLDGGGDGDWRGESHRDQSLSTFAMMKLPKDTPIYVEDEKLSIADLISESVANFTFKQGEMNWTAIAYAHYLPPNTHWTDRFDRTTTFSELTEHLIETGLEKQSCGGLHMFQAVAAIESADAKHGILDRKTRIRCRNFVRELLNKAKASQNEDGSWNNRWHVITSDATESIEETSLTDRIIVTGHMLELLHNLDGSVDTRMIVGATRWLYETLQQDVPKDVGVCPLTHALNGVRLSAERRQLSLNLVELFAR